MPVCTFGELVGGATGLRHMADMPWWRFWRPAQARHLLISSAFISYCDTGACCQVHPHAGCQAGSAPAVCSMFVTSSLLGCAVTCNLTFSHETHKNTAKGRLSKHFWPSPHTHPLCLCRCTEPCASWLWSSRLRLPS